MKSRTTILLLLLLPVLLTATAYGGNSSREFGGVGIDGAPLADGNIVVRQLVQGGPAHVAGIRIGDRLTHIDGKPASGSNFTDIVQRRLRGRSGTPVLITVRRPGETKPRHFKLIRRQLVMDRAGNRN